MSSILQPREWALQAGFKVYNTPLLLAEALEQLERLANKCQSNNPRIKRAGPGSRVELLDLNDHSRASFKLVMPEEAAPKNRQISVLSPLGSSLLNLKAGDISHIDFCGRNYKFQILNIR